MGELWSTLQCRSSQFTVSIEGIIESNSPESDYYFHILEKLDFFQEIWLAVQDLLWKEFIPRRCAATRCRDVAVCQLQAISTMCGGWLICETEFVERAIKPVSAAVAGEHPSSAIASVCCWCESDKEESCVWVTKAWVRLPPILPVFEAGSLLACNFLAPLDQPRA